jgi:hypothetical protein
MCFWRSRSKGERKPFTLIDTDIVLIGWGLFKNKPEWAGCQWLIDKNCLSFPIRCNFLGIIAHETITTIGNWPTQNLTTTHQFIAVCLYSDYGVAIFI